MWERMKRGGAALRLYFLIMLIMKNNENKLSDADGYCS